MTTSGHEKRDTLMAVRCGRTESPSERFRSLAPAFPLYVARALDVRRSAHLPDVPHIYPTFRTVHGVLQYDVRGLIAELGATLRGTATGDAGVRALYSTDSSNYRVVPDLVIVPADVDDLVAAVALASQAGAPIVLRGAGTSMAGNAIGGVVIDVSRHLNTIVDIDPAARTAVVEPGVVLTDLTGAAAAYGLTFGDDLSSASRATLGGMIANNACGSHSVAWGTTADNLRGLEVLLPGHGYDVARFLSGTEGSLAVTLRATVNLVELPGATVLLALGFNDSVAG